MVAKNGTEPIEKFRVNPNILREGYHSHYTGSPRTKAFGNPGAIKKEGYSNQGPMKYGQEIEVENWRKYSIY